MRTPQSLAVLLTLGLGSLALTSCGADAGDTANADAAPAVTTTKKLVAGDPDTWPLTGLPVSGKASSIQQHPVLVLKMDNTASSAPQEGLSSADMVVEELVEGGLTRLAAFFYSDIPGEVGPVRSMRASDIGIVSPVDGDMVTSGAAAVTIGLIDRAGIDYHSDGSPGFHRDPSRTAPYNLMTDLDDAAGAIKQRPGRPADYLSFGDEADLPKGPRATAIDVSFSGGHTTTWSYRGGAYANEDTFAAPGDEFSADNVLVLQVKIGDAGYLDPAGNPVPRTELVGSGPAMLFHGGQGVRATWTKDHLADPIELSTDDGALRVPAGRTWIELVPMAGDVTYR